MSALMQRLAMLLLPLLVAACAAAGGTQLTGVEERGARLAKAEAMFAERCKKAGVFIHRTAENVEGIFLMKLRPQGINYGNQYAMDDPYGRDFGGDAYIRSFLNGFFEANYQRPDEPRTNREEREYWIAGSSLKVIDLQTSEVMAERIGYMMDRGQGDRNSGRSPWLFAADHACPAFSSTHGAAAQINQTEKFVEKVLKPILEK